jgi:hypothetical protein
VEIALWAQAISPEGVLQSSAGGALSATGRAVVLRADAFLGALVSVVVSVDEALPLADEFSANA